MPNTVTIADHLNELNSAEILATLAKGDGTALGPTAMETLTLTLYDLATDTIINGVDHEDVLNVGRGTLDAAGHLVIALESLDSPIVGATKLENHKALIIGTWNSGKGYTSQEILFTVTNINRAP